ncbi:tRNA (adenosine(37)-N6)-threonylcarbamoyltransferase complex dimerization subunit type 1 TsaB [Candidatus Peregrinibacteria bacterium]|nr:MAG: tRNA (adenosine(37)-N6)-threonylcarbamoyltransferase complex dimerization subunit type 1 TsaB [Candidatus Peregrinibacteria bacterium]
MILALNTAQTVHELALLQEDQKELRLLKEQRWPDDHQDVETLVPRLQNLLDETGLRKEEIQAVLVVKGPGSFTSLRTGVAFANALVEGLSDSRSQRVQLYEWSTFECLAHKAATQPVLVLLPAGGADVGLYFEGELKVGPLSELLAVHPHGAELKIVAELPETLEDELHSIILEKKWKRVQGHELQTLGESLQSLGLPQIQPVEQVNALYLKGPKITLSSDRWKQVRT